MPGRPDFSTPGTSGGGQTLATQSRPEVRHVERDQTVTVAQGTSEQVEIFAPTGSIFRVKSVRLKAAPLDSQGATTGKHNFDIRTGNGIRVTFAQSFHDSFLHFRNSRWDTASSTVSPSEEIAQLQAVSDMIATENEPIKMKYSNNTDADQENQRDYRLTVEEVSF